MRTLDRGSRDERPLIIVGKDLLRSAKDARLTKSLNSWREITEHAKWRHLIDVRCHFPSADSVGKCTVFNIRHNRYRLITLIHYQTGIVDVRGVLTHAEYSRKGWKNVCGC